MTEPTVTQPSTIPPGSVVIPPETTWAQLQAIAQDVVEIKAAVRPALDLVGRVAALERKLWTVAGAASVVVAGGVSGVMALFHH